MVSLSLLTESLQSGVSLTRTEAMKAARCLVDPDVSIMPKTALLRALTEKGETSVEVAAFAAFFRTLARKPPVARFAPEAIDLCGTGGDHSSTFNISTAASFVVAAAGVPVFKHGNRSITSQCGSADFLSALGFDLEPDGSILQTTLERFHFAFFFAPAYHPAFRSLAPIRKALAAEKRRTIFNLLGLLLNPGSPAHQLVGVFAAEWVEPIAEALDRLGLKRGLVVHGKLPEGRSMDELSCCGETRVAGVGALRDIRAVWTPADFGLEPCAPEDIKGGDAAQNLDRLYRLLTQTKPDGLHQAIAMNAGAALWVAGRVTSLVDGACYAQKLLFDGTVAAWLKQMQVFYRHLRKISKEEGTLQKGRLIL